ncbi:hypothetical protein MKK88_16190 [Methylobacterium sp. E-005]|uniref:hypothetical protein n=1 Tax=Methylobacterium sp. E-005 TaxID=2836549 RepID=UPI001FB9267C|nr:hypothetical protein [Methylobacterium sp. E-005]MCJ2087509.1 hypothetical protein [Methylobacterium sp. E-005]
MAADFEIAGSRYRFEGMPAQTETRILRRFAPLIGEAVPLVLMPGPRLALRQNIDVVKVGQTVFAGWGKLSDDDLDMIERASLGALLREVGPDWHSVWPKGEAEPAFPDIDGAVMSLLLGRALGFVVKRWIDGGGDTVPAEIRAAMSKLH